MRRGETLFASVSWDSDHTVCVGLEYSSGDHNFIDLQWIINIYVSHVFKSKLNSNA
jgi:hypothetical protein